MMIKAINNISQPKVSNISFERKRDKSKYSNNAFKEDEIVLSNKNKHKKMKKIILFSVLFSAMAAAAIGLISKYKKNIPITNTKSPTKILPKYRVDNPKSLQPANNSKPPVSIPNSDSSNALGITGTLGVLGILSSSETSGEKDAEIKKDLFDNFEKKALSGDVEKRISEFDTNKIQVFYMSKAKVSALKKLDKQVISMIDDQTLSNLCWSMADNNHSAKKIKRLQKEFTLKELETIFQKDYLKSELIKWIQFERRQRHNEKDILTGIHVALNKA